MSLLIYGANGYTGELIAREAVRRGLPVVVAGRRAEALLPLAEELRCPHRAFALDDPAAVDGALAGVKLMLGCAGPFALTWRPLAEACLRTGTHYADITGEIEVFEELFARDAAARASGVMLLPGVGFDVVPSDCLAQHLARRLPDAVRLTLCFAAVGGVSRGTATTSVRKLGEPGMVRRDGQLVAVPSAARTRRVDVGAGEATAVLIPWGDVATAYHSTGIPNIETYLVAPWALRVLLRSARSLGWLYRRRALRALLTWLVRLGKPGPTAQQRARGATLLWGEVENAAGERATARLRGPEGYAFTVLTALACAERVLGGDAPVGFQTPATAYGADFVLEIPGVERTDL